MRAPRRRTAFAGHLTGLLSIGLAATACSDHRATAIMVAVSSEADVPAELDRLEISVVRDGVTRFDRVYSLQDQAHVPGTLTLTPRSAELYGGPLAITVRGGKTSTGDGWRVSRLARLGFSQGHTKLLRLRLERACFDVDCGPNLTCIGGACVSPDVDPETLPDADGTPEGQG
jgi:hypothetical protein